MFGNYEQLLLVKNYTSIGDSFMKNFVRLSEVCTISASKAYIEEEDAWLLNLDKVESKTGRVLEHEVVPKEKLNGSIVQFDTGNVLYSKLRPNLNKVVLPEKNGYATSEMLPLRPCESKLTKGYLAEYLRSDNFVSWAVGKTAGAKMPRLGTKVLMDKMIPLPPLEEQHKIVSLFSVVNHVISLRQQQLAKLDELVKARFVEMFGDPVSNQKEWKLVPLGKRCKIITGNTPSRAELENYGEFIEWIKSDNINTPFMFITKAQECLSKTGFEKCRFVEAGSLLMTCIAGSINCIGNVAVTDRRVAFNQQINAIVPAKDKVVYLYWLMMLSKPVINRTINMALKGILSKRRLAEMEFPFPPLDLQEKFEGLVEKVNKSRRFIQKSLEQMEILKKALMQKYFG